MHHRTDIDGLRAVAVLPILLFHAGVGALAGGFVGVDVFFVISGYLITGIILREIAAGSFTIGRFYQRRVVRIFPALFTVIAATLAAGCVILFPTELNELGRSSAAAVAFVSNIFFWGEADYFAGAAEFKPLLHTWSLGVEEQFYILFPLLLMAVMRWRPTWLRASIALGIAASLVAGFALAGRSTSAAFYLIPARAWELGLGCAVAVGLFPALGNRVARAATAWTGLAMIAVAIVVVRPALGFPMPFAALPAIGTALVIAYGEGGSVHRVLALAPLRWLGAISYSLYLWHWPIITFWRIETGMHLSVGETAGLVTASVFAATLSYHLVEQPALRRFRTAATRPVLLVGAIGLVAVAAASLVVSAQADRFRRLPPAIRHLVGHLGYADSAAYRYQYRPGPCFRTSQETDMQFDPDTCLAALPDRSTMVVFGDSHAAQYWRALSLRYPRRNVLQATASGCRSLGTGGGTRRCRDVSDHVMGPLLRSGRVDQIVIAARWQAEEVPGLLAMVERIRAAGVEPIVIGPTIEYDGDLPAILARAMLHDRPGDADTLRNRDRIVLDRRIAAEMRTRNIRYVSVIAIESTPDWHVLTPGGTPLQFDYGHLTLDGSRWVVARMPEF